MRRFMLTLTAAVVATTLSTAPSAQAAGRKSCAELKQEIAAKIDARGVQHYHLEIVEPAATGDRRVVGSCDGGTQRIVYTREKLAPTPVAQAVANND